MKTLLLTLTLLCVSASSALASDYIMVAVSGFRTIRDKAQAENILSNDVDVTGERSGVWSSSPTSRDSKKIIKNAYLTHYSTDREIDSVIKLFVDENDKCINDVKMILMVNSWGAKVSQRLAKSYYEKCGLKPFMTFMIEGISKPTNFAYTKDLLSEECINFFQNKSSLRGNKIDNCRNFLLDYPLEKRSLYNTHIKAEWDASSAAQTSFLNFLKNGEKNFTVNELDHVVSGMKEI